LSLVKNYSWSAEALLKEFVENQVFQQLGPFGTFRLTNSSRLNVGMLGMHGNYGPNVDQ
jgi:hypothetical protein